MNRNLLLDTTPGPIVRVYPEHLPKLGVPAAVVSIRVPIARPLGLLPAVVSRTTFPSWGDGRCFSAHLSTPFGAIRLLRRYGDEAAVTERSLPFLLHGAMSGLFGKLERLQAWDLNANGTSWRVFSDRALQSENVDVSSATAYARRVGRIDGASPAADKRSDVPWLGETVQPEGVLRWLASGIVVAPFAPLIQLAGMGMSTGSIPSS